MHVLFVEPCFPSYQMKFVEALVRVGARVTGIGETPRHMLPTQLKPLLSGYEHVHNVTDERALFHAVRRCQERSWVDRLEATVEAHILPVAKVRESCTIPGTSVRTAFLCRDKPAMKEALRKAGVPCAQSTGASSPAEVKAFIAAVGYPVIIKPPDGAGAAGAIKVSSDAELPAALENSRVADGVTVAVEEFVDGHEGFYDTLTIHGDVAVEFISHYYPNVLHAMRTRWISPQVVTTNRLDAAAYAAVRTMAAQVNKALGIGTSATHMEWFFGSKGLKFSEIGCRPPGVGMWDIYCAANEFDLYEEWAHAIVYGRINRQPTRRYAAGMIALRPDHDGTIRCTDGMEWAQNTYGQYVIDCHFPAPGTPTQPVEAGYWANAWLRMRHPDYDALLAMLDDIGKNMQVRAE